MRPRRLAPQHSLFTWIVAGVLAQGVTGCTSTSGEAPPPAAAPAAPEGNVVADAGSQGEAGAAGGTAEPKDEKPEGAAQGGDTGEPSAQPAVGGAGDKASLDSRLDGGSSQGETLPPPGAALPQEGAQQAAPVDTPPVAADGSALPGPEQAVVAAEASPLLAKPVSVQDHPAAEPVFPAMAPKPQESAPARQHVDAPADASSPGGHLVPENGARMAYRIRHGDTLGTIAAQVSAHSRDWKLLPDQHTLSNPHRIYAGGTIYYTVNDNARQFAMAYEHDTKTTLVKRGDTLYAIAKAQYHDGGMWRTLWKDNPKIKNPDRLVVGTTLILRSEARLTQASLKHGKSRGKGHHKKSRGRKAKGTGKLRKASMAVPNTHTEPPTTQAPAEAPAVPPEEAHPQGGSAVKVQPADKG